jgi:probable rRNA maturation factor
VEIVQQQSAAAIEPRRLRRAVRTVLRQARLQKARVSLALVDDRTIARLNRRFLGHRGPTDVLSFLLERSPGYLEGELVVGADVACRAAPRYGWSAQQELLLYVIHGALHLVGYDDAQPGERARMRRRERELLAQLGSPRSEFPSGALP